MAIRQYIVVGLLLLNACLVMGQERLNDSTSVVQSDVVDSISVAYDEEEVQRIEKKRMDKSDYIPVIHGTLRAKYEYQPELGASRFAVRTARVSVTGNVLPILGYKAEIDLSDYGQIKMLDAYMRVFPVQGLTFTAGQMRVPFSIDAHRSPHTQFFANRSFLAKQVGNVRDVGFMLGYTLPVKMPISVEAGMFNGKGLLNQKDAWTRDFCYTGKLSLMFVDGLNLTLSAKTIKPAQVRATSYDAGMYYEFWRFHIEGEYLYKQYENHAFQDVHTANAFLIYNQPLPKVFDKMSFLIRYDYMSDHWDGKTYSTTYDEAGNVANAMAITPTDYERQRLTAGITLSMRPTRKANGKIGGVFRESAEDFRMDLRLNYEKYFYADPTKAHTSEKDKLAVELMLRF